MKNGFRKFFDYKVIPLLFYYLGVVFLTVGTSVGFIFYPEQFWPVYPMIWFVPAFFFLYGMMCMIFHLTSRLFKRALIDFLMLSLFLIVLVLSLVLTLIMGGIYSGNDNEELEVSIDAAARVVLERADLEVGFPPAQKGFSRW